jgi:hypothetical protein
MKSIHDMVDERKSADAAEQKARADAEAEKFRKHLERVQLRKKRLAELRTAIDETLDGETSIGVRQLGDGAVASQKFELRYLADQVLVTLHDLGDNEVDFFGDIVVGGAIFDFYLQPDGTFIQVRFRPNPIWPNKFSSTDDQHPKGNGPAFKRWAVDMRRMTGEIAPEFVPGSTFKNVLLQALELMLKKPAQRIAKAT